MRHAMAVKGRWLRARLESVQACSTDRLCGRAPAPAPPKGDQVLAAGTTAANGAAGSKAAADGGKVRKANKNDAVEAARARFLARSKNKS